MAKGVYDKLILIRSAVPTRDIGFLPGNEKEKSAVYEAPYKDIAIELFQRGDAYEILKTKGLVHFMTTSFIRGVTLRDAVILVDECQNMSFHELDSIITRVGENCRVVFCGDFRQSDLKTNGLNDFFRVLRSMEQFDFIDFEIKDIVRSDFVKSYITAKTELDL
jgi:phosphate starvation-inducible protein PhoH